MVQKNGYTTFWINIANKSILVEDLWFNLSQYFHIVVAKTKLITPNKPRVDQESPRAKGRFERRNYWFPVKPNHVIRLTHHASFSGICSEVYAPL
jgi:hypothetical protein